MADETRSLLILGLGNLLCADDGLGVHAVDALGRGYELPDGVRVLDGGTLGLGLLSTFEGASDVILVDAIAAAAPPGALVRLDGEDVAPAVRHRLSCHQIGVADLLDALWLLESYPERLVLWGMVPGSLDLDTRLSPRVAAHLPRLVARVAAEAARLGFELEARETGEGDASWATAGSGGAARLLRL